MSRARCYLLMLMEQAPMVGWSVLGIVILLIVIGFLVSPWIGIAAVGLSAFIVVTAISFVMLLYGFNTLIGLNMSSHFLGIDGDNLVVTVEDEIPLEIQLSRLNPYKIYPGGVLVPVTEGDPKINKNSQGGWIWIPTKAFNTDDDFKSFLKRLYEKQP